MIRCGKKKKKIWLYKCFVCKGGMICKGYNVTVEWKKDNIDILFILSIIASQRGCIKRPTGGASNTNE